MNYQKDSPADIRSMMETGQSCVDQGDFVRACHTYRELLKNYPENPAIHYKLAESSKLLGDLDTALGHYRKALQLAPEFPEACAGIASVYELQGDSAQALRELSRYIDHNDANPLVALVFGKICQQQDELHTGLHYVNRALSAGGLDRVNAGLLHFMAGHLNASLERYGMAFKHYEQANRLRGCHFDRAAYADEVKNIINTFNRETLDNIPASGTDTGKLVFIVGMPRSGTSLAEQILATHEGVYAGGELPHLGEATAAFRALFPDGQYSRAKAASIHREAIDALARQYLQHMQHVPADIQRITDKMPYNFLRLQVAERLFPGAHIIHCTRDPLDTCISCYCNDFVGVHSYAYDLADLGHFYKGYRQLTGHWKKILRLPWFELSYEALVRNPEKTISKLVDFCGLEWNDRFLRFFETDRFVNTASYNQVRKPLYTGSVGRWKHYREFIGPLLAALENR